MRYYLLFLFTFSTIWINAQVKIGANIGVGQSYLYPRMNDNQFIVDNSFQPNLLYGVKSEFHFKNKKAKITINSNYYYKRMLASEMSFNPLRSINFHAVNTTLILNKYILSNTYLGIGIHYVYLPFIQFNYQSGSSIKLRKKNDLGIVGSVNYSIKNFIFDFNYGYSLITNRLHKDQTEQKFQPMIFTQLQVAYLLPLRISNE